MLLTQSSWILTLEDVSSALKSRELKKSFSELQDVLTAAGLTARGSTCVEDKRSKGKSKEVTCFACREPGHYSLQEGSSVYEEREGRHGEHWRELSTGRGL